MIGSVDPITLWLSMLLKAATGSALALTRQSLKTCQQTAKAEPPKTTTTPLRGFATARRDGAEASAAAHHTPTAPLQLISRRSPAAVPRAGQALSPHGCSVVWRAKRHPLCSTRCLGLANKIPVLSHLRLHYDDREASFFQNALNTSLPADGSKGKGDALQKAPQWYTRQLAGP